MKYILDERFILLETGLYGITEAADMDDIPDDDTDDIPDDDSDDIPDDGSASSSQDNTQNKKIPTNSINWEQEFQACKTNEQLENFWKRYYEIMFGKTGDVIRKQFHTAIKYLNPQYGWTAEENPIIALLADKTEQPLILNASYGYSNNYLVRLASAESKNLINLEHLIKSPLGDFDILRNIEFRKLSTSELEAWLRLRDTAIREINNVKNKFFFANSFLVAGNATKSDTQITPELVVRGKLLAIGQATKRLSRFTGKNLAGKQEASAKDVEKILNNIKGDPKVLFYFCYDVLPLFSDKCLTLKGPEVMAVFKQERQKQSKALSVEQVEACKRALNLKNASYTGAVACELLYQLLKKAGVNVPEPKQEGTE